MPVHSALSLLAEILARSCRSRPCRPAAVALDSMLQEIAELNEAEVNAAVARTLLLLESIMIVLLRVIEIYLPILDPIKWVAR